MSEILVSTPSAGLQHQPAIAPFGNAHFCVAWADTNDGTIKAQLFRANGARSGSDFVVSALTAAEVGRAPRLPAIIRTGSGVVIAWMELAGDPAGPRPQVNVQRFDQDARAAGPQIEVSTTDVDPDHGPAIAFMSDGGFVVIWADTRPDRRIVAQRFGFDGSRLGTKFAVSVTEGFHQRPMATPLVGGNYVVAWRADPSAPGGGALTLRIFDLEGSPIGGETIPNLVGFVGDKAITLLDTGRFVVAHVRDEGLSDIGERKSIVEINVFLPDGTLSNVGVTAGSDPGIGCSSPALAPLPGGRFLVAWAQRSAETSATSPSVRAKLFSETDASIGQEVQVNTTTASGRLDVCAATVSGGDEGEAAFIAWAGDSGTGADGSDLAVKGRVLRILPEGLA